MNKDLLNDVNTLYNSDNLPGSSTKLNDLNDRVKTMNDSLSILNGVETNGLSRQNDIKQIITTESDRLIQKKDTIDQAIITQNRIIYFNDNNRKRYAAYLRILITLTVTLAIVWLIQVIRKNVEVIPDWILDILIIASISIGIIIIYNYFIDISERTKYNFDEINMDAPTLGASDKSNGDDSSGGTGALCMGEECCKPATAEKAGSTWDEVIGKCLNDPIVTPVTTERFTTIKSVKPTDSFEYTEYSPYK